MAKTNSTRTCSPGSVRRDSDQRGGTTRSLKRLNRPITCVIGAVLISGVGVGRLAARSSERPQGGVAGIGPDVIVGSLQNILKYGTVNGISAYAVGTTSCNIGDQFLIWCDTDVPGFCNRTQHPVIAQNMYRLKDGRIEQIGMSWLKHGFCALSDSLCGTCQDDLWGCDALGVGCSDPYDAILNGGQNNLGPRSQVQPALGLVAYPFTASPPAQTIGRRLQVEIADLQPAQNQGALYFVEGHYVTFDDAAWGNDNNNASYRRMLVGPQQGSTYLLSLNGPTFQQLPAIHAWRDHGLGLNTPDPAVELVNVDVENDGRFILACKASDNGDGTWRYEYAVHNLCSERGARLLSVPIGAGATITAVGHHVINHHSGEPYESDGWQSSVAAGAVVWQTGTFVESPNANALRWSTLYNFWFTADRPPATVLAKLGLFKPGSASDPVVQVVAPNGGGCAGEADLDCDGAVGGADLGLLLSAWGGDGTADLDANGIVDGADLGVLLAAWSP